MTVWHRWMANAARAARAAGLALLVAPLATLPALAQGQDQIQSPQVNTAAAVVLMYHRFGEDAYPSTSVTMEQFESHIAELTSGAYTVVPLSQVVAALQTGADLPDRAVAITIDDAYSSVYKRAWPIFMREGIPFTLFIATEPVDRGTSGYMTWQQIAELHAAGVEIGSQTVTHPHMPIRSAARNREELIQSAAILTEKLGAKPTLFAYPYGEASREIMDLVQSTGYVAAFGQHSGVANVTNVTNDPFYLPRFPINVAYGGIDRFTRLINALPLPIEGLTPSEPLLPREGVGNPPAFGFTVKPGVGSLDNLQCYHSDASQISAFERLGNRFEVRFDGPFAAGRTRINCTMQGPSGRWRWFGMQYYVPME